MIAVVCDTPYQLMSAVMVSRQIAPDETMVFFINRYLYFKEQNFNYKDAHPLTEKILYYGRAHMSPKKLLPGLIKPEFMLRSIEGWNPDYDFSAIIASRTAYMATYLKRAAQKRKQDIPVYIIEEGIGEYTGGFIDTRFTRVCRALKQKTHADDVEAAYFSAPELYPFKLNFPIKKVPAPDSAAKEIITSIFNLEAINEDNPLSRYKCIFLSEPNSCEMKDAKDALAYDALEDEITDLTVKTAGIENTVIKVHPLDAGYKKDGVDLYRSALPMESLVLSLNNNSKFFVSSMSTAMLTPKLLFGYEPGLIFTYKILDPLLKKFIADDGLRERYYDFIRGVISSYENPDKCAVPETLEELEQTVARFSSTSAAY